MPKNGIDVADPGRSNGPSLGTGLRSAALSLICVGVVLFHSIKCAEHPDWHILSECAAWPEQVEERVARYRAVMSNCIGEPSRRAGEALQRSGAAWQVEKSPFRGRVRGVLGSEVDGNGVGGRIFNRGAGGVATGRRI